MTWRVAESLDRLLAQLDAIAPRRAKVSDGSIGDARHRTRDSDHNPWLVLGGQPLVTARDFTHHPAGGLDCERLAADLREARDPRVKYVIWNRRIMSGAGGRSPWSWRAYNGPSPHDHHLHLSVVADARCRSGAAWTLPGLTTAGGATSTGPTPAPDPQEDTMATAEEIAAAVWRHGIRNGFGHVVEAQQILTASERRTADAQQVLATLADQIAQLRSADLDEAAITDAVTAALAARRLPAEPEGAEPVGRISA